MWKNRNKKTPRKYFAYAAMGIGSILIGLLLIPTGLLIFMIYTIWSITDHIVRWGDR